VEATRPFGRDHPTAINSPGIVGPIQTIVTITRVPHFVNFSAVYTWFGCVQTPGALIVEVGTISVAQ